MANTPCIQQESMRWHLLIALNKTRPYTANEMFLLAVMQRLYADTSEQELRQALDYLADRKMAVLTKEVDGVWLANLTRLGVEMVEYTVDGVVGIARPEKYWDQ
ncbi:hypothetical protein KP22_02520 [Pectobacterium betavasculorum]|uniref:Phage protein n=1 Tax=Pectobacterium betavasculorum TaxID=55207 RepID=A0A093UFI9_9GAMM|nr:hypothetical protein [Pectobacterium betavasculorum]KFX06983.1 hypothetical protein KP22_02520 [Pectobacterium betavasculorum]